LDRTTNQKKPLKIIPLGGLGEIGMNMTVLEYGDSIIVVDCGLMFPEDYMPGIDIVIPDITYLKKNREKIKAFVITHGHEDHTGALPFVLREIKAPVYATTLTIGLIENKLREFRLLDETTFETVRPRDTVAIGHRPIFNRVYPREPFHRGRMRSGHKDPCGGCGAYGGFQARPDPGRWRGNRLCEVFGVRGKGGARFTLRLDERGKGGVQPFGKRDRAEP
jgi:hypothetical protein